MNLEEVIEVIEVLEMGYNKENGEELFKAAENPKLKNALKKSLEILKAEKIKKERKESLPQKAYTGWTVEEEKTLMKKFNKYKEKLDFAKLVEKLAKNHQRTEGSIKSKINKLI